MELVYLWVEDYKNIHKQGFNFSPQFKCEYDEDTNELKIEKKEYTSIFPDNINVTAIVGENGSGKSSLLKSIIALHDGIIKYYYKKDGNRIFSTITAKTIKYLYFNNKTKEYISNFTVLRDNNGKKIEQKSLDENKLSCVSYFHTYIDTQSRTDFNFQSIEVISDENIKYDKVYKHIKPSNGYIAYYLMESYYLQKIIMVSDKIKFPDDFIFPDVLEITPNTILFQEGKDREEKLQNLYNKSNLSSIGSNFFALMRFLAIYNIYQELDEGIDLSNLLDNLDSDILTREQKNYFKRVCCLEKMIKSLKTIDKNKMNFFKISDNKQQLSKIIRLHSKIVSLGKGIEILKFEMDNPKLSDGQMQYLKLFSLIATGVEESNEINNLIILDEAELFMHPNWKKQFMNYLITMLDETYPNENFHIIFTTHSPFLLSDLPKENVIFLEKEKEKDGKCKNVTNEIDIETFGANIHTLLSHGFFMKDGLMGEFAKGEINKAITKLNQIKLSEDDIKFCENIIKITGEPIIKRQMQKMLDSKRLSKMDAISKKIEDMSYELEVLKGYQAQYVKDELNDRAKKQYKQRKNDDKDTE